MQKQWKHLKLSIGEVDAGGWIAIEGKHWLLHSICEWEQLFGKWNWIDFHPCLIHVMRDIVLPGVEVEVVLLGVGFRIRVNGDWNTTKEGREITQNVAAITGGTFERTTGECPICNGTGKVGVLKATCKQCGQSGDDCTCCEDCGQPYGLCECHKL